MRIDPQKRSAAVKAARSTDKSTATAFPTRAPDDSVSSASIDKAQSSAILGALIDLQSGGGRAKTFAAAQRMLDFLDELRIGLLDEGVDENVLRSLVAETNGRPHADSPPELVEIYREISLRARVELAKRGL